MEANCTVRRLLFYIEGCIDDEELAGVMLGVFSAALWTLVHISFYTHQRRNAKLNRYVMTSITGHMIADGLSCIGAILSQQKSLQVIFALCGTVVNAAIGIHCCCTRYPNIETKGSTIDVVQKKPVTDRCHCLCSVFFLVLCLMFITMCITEYLTISDDQIIYHNSSKFQPYMHTVLTIGYVLGTLSALSYWLSKFYEVVESYKSCRNKGSNSCMYLTAITGDITYLLGIYIQMTTIYYIIQTLPWTLARMGLIGIHIGIIFQRRWSNRQQIEKDKVELLKKSRKSDDSDWSDDSSIVMCGTCDLQTSVKQMICNESPWFPKDLGNQEKDNEADCYKELNIDRDKSEKQLKQPEIETLTIMESVSSESPELEWDFEWLSEPKKKHSPKADKDKLTAYDGYYKVVEWFKKSWDMAPLSDTDDFIEKNNTKNET